MDMFCMTLSLFLKICLKAKKHNILLVKFRKNATPNGLHYYAWLCVLFNLSVLFNCLTHWLEKYKIWENDILFIVQSLQAYYNTTK